ncbi:hypothetical protein [Brachyspira intermedia]|uniref:hypothetical protein n=1 Tax=Brachyspira intermedia TaxID=84377 RepID=UPI0030063494
MIKKVLLIAAFIIFAVSCSKTPTDPTNNGNTGDSGIIEGPETPTTTVTEFLKKYSGRYYEENTDGAIYMSYRIENGEIYESHNSSPIVGKKILSGNKLQIEYQDNNGNSKITILNFINNNIYQYRKNIFKKESFSEQIGFIKVGNPISSLSQYSGNYYTSGMYENQEEKYYSLLIGNDGQVYFMNPTDDNEMPVYNFKTVNFANNSISISMSYSYQGQSVEVTIIYSIKDGKLIGTDTYFDGKLDGVELKKSDLLNDYVGTYSSQDGSATLNVSKDYAYISGSISINGEAILLGNTMTIAQYVQSSYTYKRHTIVFSDDKKTATYTDPDTKKEIVLTRQGA